MDTANNMHPNSQTNLPKGQLINKWQIMHTKSKFFSEKGHKTVHHWFLFLFFYMYFGYMCVTKMLHPSPPQKMAGVLLQPYMYLPIMAPSLQWPPSSAPKVAIVVRSDHSMLINIIIPGIGNQMIEMLGICWGWHIISFWHQLKWKSKVHVYHPIPQAS